ncbi:MAG: hypothetical protein KGL95_11350 [Patescibacteria group bacterium]|nr:hypothetical protein [Patescibacteria group bacterium]
MTKQKRTVTVSGELDAAIGLLAIAKDMNYSEYVETRLRMVPEILQEIQQVSSLPENPPAMIKGDIKEFLKRSPRDTPNKKNKVLA